MHAHLDTLDESHQDMSNSKENRDEHQELEVPGPPELASLTRKRGLFGQCKDLPCLALFLV